MADVESLQIEIQVALCSLSEERLKEVCSELKIILPPESKGRLVFIRALNKYLETEELDYEKLKGMSNKTQNCAQTNLHGYTGTWEKKNSRRCWRWFEHDVPLPPNA